MEKNLSPLTCTFPAEVGEGDTLPSFQLMYNKCVLFAFCSVSHFWYFFLVITLCKIDPQHSVEVPASVAKCKKAVMCVMEKRGVSDELPSGLRCGAADPEFNVNQSYLLNKVLNGSTHKIKNVLIS